VGTQVFLQSFSRITEPAVYVWVIAAIGLSALFWDRSLRPHAVFVAGFTLFSFLAVCPGLYFRQHYYILFLPAVAVLAGIAVNSGTQLARSHSPRAVAAPLLVYLAAFAASIVFQRTVFFDLTPLRATRATYGVNPFPEAVEISNYLAAKTPPDARIAILGSEPEIYFYSHRRSATGYIYMYPLMEEQKYAPAMLQDMIGEIEKSNPEFLLFVQVAYSWLARPGNPQLESLLSWANDYVGSHYELVGVADLVAPDHTEYRWDEDARHYQQQSPNAIRVFRKVK